MHHELRRPQCLLLISLALAGLLQSESATLQVRDARELDNLLEMYDRLTHAQAFVRTCHGRRREIWMRMRAQRHVRSILSRAYEGTCATNPRSMLIAEAYPHDLLFRCSSVSLFLSVLVFLFLHASVRYVHYVYECSPCHTHTTEAKHR